MKVVHFSLLFLISNIQFLILIPSLYPNHSTHINGMNVSRFTLFLALKNPNHKHNTTCIIKKKTLYFDLISVYFRDHHEIWAPPFDIPPLAVKPKPLRLMHALHFSVIEDIALYAWREENSVFQFSSFSPPSFFSCLRHAYDDDSRWWHNRNSV